MKKVLSLLVAFVFLQTQTWALSGGPNFGGAGSQAITGTYAGVLLPDANVPGGLVALDANALGLFAIAIPQTAFATGTCAFFNKGEVFVGKIVGIADPESGTLRGLMEASAIRIITVEVAAGSAVGAFGSDVRTVGKLEAEIVPGDGFNSAQRLEGTAVLNSFQDGVRNPDGTPVISGTVQFIIDGFKQSADTSVPQQINFDINSNSSTP